MAYQTGIVSLPFLPSLSSNITHLIFLPSSSHIYTKRSLIPSRARLSFVICIIHYTLQYVLRSSSHTLPASRISCLMLFVFVNTVFTFTFRSRCRIVCMLHLRSRQVCHVLASPRIATCPSGCTLLLMCHLPPLRHLFGLPLKLLLICTITAKHAIVSSKGSNSPSENSTTTKLGLHITLFSKCFKTLLSRSRGRLHPLTAIFSTHSGLLCFSVLDVRQ